MKQKKIYSVVLILIGFVNFLGRAEEPGKLEIETGLNYPLNFNISLSYFLRFHMENNTAKYTELKLNGSLKPANILGSFNLKLAYLPFINFIAEASLGTGWAYPALNFYGIAENQNVNNFQVIEPLYFSKLFFNAQGGIELYFNLNSKIRNEWADLILKTEHFINYKALFPARKEDFWFFDNDLGENRNGAAYKGSYSIEYNMPLYLNGIRLEFITYKKLYKPLPGTINKAEKLWNFELRSSLFFKPAEKIRIKLNAVWKTAPIYYNFKDKTHFTKKIINSKKIIDMFFESAGVSLIFKL
ncbi:MULTISPECIES: hypothetical protein [unclassified Treponema]|uniref:hypothetical protein n=1 Tax=unclassified Treponema TaxID=2638727 RepID=UPI0020A2B0F4|nr:MULTISPECIES: hypothetical protein [unclassified Treponema]UTC67994.1 hypothetical protein E4O06_04945 [Treponema sp. OMZ 789]UTC70716.1 hypothetical protein E4O01_05090 [Treponema sp. OMZ 790]UTC73436.1 hypothetical protein E4O02_05180 [Treponema sp. OMZ 791]